MTPIKKSLLACAVALVGSTAVQAQVFAPGDLVLYFQNPTGTGSSNTLFVNLGHAPTTFRGAATGPDVANMINIVNINSQLTTAFGSGWASETTLHMGLAAARSNSATLGAGGGTVNGDPNRTIYVGQGRNSVGTVGASGTVGYSGFSDAQLGNAAGGIINMNLSGSNNGLTNAGSSLVLGVGTSTIDDQNPFLVSPTNQGVAFSIFGGGVQQATSSSGKPASIGTFGPVANVEFALDLYRIVSVTGKTGQLAGDVAGTGSYEGTMVLDSTGNVSFVTIPEPSTYAMFGLGALLIGYVVRRRKAARAQA